MRPLDESTPTFGAAPAEASTRGAAAPEGTAPPAPVPPADATGSPPDLPVLLAFERRLNAATPRTPVTALIVAANSAVFAVMALWYGHLTHFNSHILMAWGAAYAPRTFGGQWWRLATAMFLHGGLGHLAANLCFLLLIATLVERLLGPARFAVVYLFAGLGGTLLAMGWFPAGVLVGASGALYGVYGAFLGCWLRGPRTIPLCLFGRYVGVLVLYAGITLLLDYCDQESRLIPHLGGLLFGLVGGLLFGHVLRPQPAWRKRGRFILAATACAILLGLTAAGVQTCIRKPVAILARYDAARARERALMGRFVDGLRLWRDEQMSDADLRRLLQDQLLPEWDRMRKDLGLQLPPEYAVLEQQRISVRELLARCRSSGPGREPKVRRKPLEREYDEMYRLYLKLRADNWAALADALGSGSIMGTFEDFGPRARALAAAREDHSVQAAEPLMDMLFLEVLRAGLDDLANEDNPLQQWLWFSRHRGHEKKQPAAGSGSW